MDLEANWLERKVERYTNMGISKAISWYLPTTLLGMGSQPSYCQAIEHLKERGDEPNEGVGKSVDENQIEKRF